MPSILIEAGFISNLEEEQFIGSSGGQDKIVDAIFRAFSDYKADIEGLTVTDDPDEVIEVVPPKDTIKPEVQQPVVKDTVVKENVAFRVQFATSPTKKPTNSQEFSHLTDVRVYYHSSTYKYTSGNFTSVTEAINYQKEVQQKGFKDAFVVAFVNEERVSVEKAEEVLKNQKK
jgi:N-acetylmuramoyl-L-alanine amidase